MHIYPVFIPQAGCESICIYCNQAKISGIHSFDLHAQLAHIKRFCSKHIGKPKQVAFYGGSFTNLDPDYRNFLLDTVDAYIDTDTTYRVSAKPNAIDKDILIWCKKRKITTIELGIQDFDDRVLRASQRGYDSQCAVASCQLIKAMGLELGIQLMPGLPDCDAQSLANNLQCLRAIEPAFIRLYPTIVIKDTKLAELYREGKYTPLSLEEAIAQCIDYCEMAEKISSKVIKIGIPSTIATSDIIAGPYHPAFGEFVKAERLIKQILQGYENGKVIYIDKTTLSLLMGHDRKYYKKLCERIGSCTPLIQII